jgi:predicted ATPase
MDLKKIKLERYKRIDSAELVLSGVNVIVGGNNCGKSSLLQGIHFSITASVAARQQGQTTFASDLLLYNPTPDFSVLRNGTPYLNQSGTGNSTLNLYADCSLPDGGTEEISYAITLYKGRNHGNIGCNREGDYLRLGADVTDPKNLYSIYVPGLAGIAQYEELRAKAIVKRGVASGDANLYLRNIIYYIKENDKLTDLNGLLSTVFPGIEVEVEFDEDKDQRLNVYINSQAGRYPIELSGTGLLQVLQIYSYITYFSPKLLLLDEPDSHLHPDNQVTLCQAIVQISEVKKCQILLCTHSRHVVDALSDCANFIWMKNGNIQEQGPHIEKLPLLLDLGALDSFDKLRAGQISLIVLTEDRNRDYLEFLLQQNSFPMEDVLIYSYRTSSNIEGAILFVDFLKSIAPGCKVMIHRDRDFMTDNEAANIHTSISTAGAIPFLTRGSDIESYFIESSHIQQICGISIEDTEQWLAQIAQLHHNDIQLQFTRKRDEIKNKMYRDNRDDCPDTILLIGTAIPLEKEKRKGKFMLKKIRGSMQERLGRTVELKAASQALNCTLLQAAKEQVWPV